MKRKLELGDELLVPLDSIGEIFRCIILPKNSLSNFEWLKWRTISKPVQQLVDRIYLSEIGLTCGNPGLIPEMLRLITSYSVNQSILDVDQLKSLMGNPVLSSLRLNMNHDQSKDLLPVIEECCKSIEDNNHITCLSIIRSSHIKGNIFEVLCSSLERNGTLTGLELVGLHLLGEEVERILSVVSKKRSFKNLNISGITHTSSLYAKDHFSTLIQTNYLTWLNISQNPLTEEMMMRVFTSLSANKSLTHIDVSGCIKSSQSNSKMVLKALNDAVVSNKTLTSLNISDLCMGEFETAQFFQSMILNKTIKRLFMRGNHLGDEGTRQLCLWLQANTLVEKLYLEKCGIKGSYFFPILTICHHLTHLDIAGNDIGAEGKLLPKVVKSALLLSYLDIQNTQIGNEDIQALSESLIGHPSMTWINISDNYLSSQTVDDMFNLHEPNGILGIDPYCFHRDEIVERRDGMFAMLNLE